VILTSLSSSLRLTRIEMQHYDFRIIFLPRCTPRRLVTDPFVAFDLFLFLQPFQFLFQKCEVLIVVGINPAVPFQYRFVA